MKRVIMVMFDSLNRNMLEPYGCTWTHTPNFQRLAEKTVVFDDCYAGSLPCMPARRELHTGRYNFLHRSWGPLEPFDDSMPEQLNHGGIHSHLSTDHYHYFEDGGATYHSRYRTWEGFRGQEGDAWKGVVNFDHYPENYRNQCDGVADSWGHNWVPQDFINRSFMDTEDKQPQSMTFEAGKDFIRENSGADQWFLQIETFDPHEPFFSQEKYKKLYPHHYEGGVYDWPDYRPLGEEDTEEDILHLRMEYAALLTMCDEKLGQILDLMDTHDMWQDTMLIVNTDHGFLLGEHGYWAKCHCPFYHETARIPLFCWSPQWGKKGIHVKGLVQNIDIPATILDYFGLELPPDMQGRPLLTLMGAGGRQAAFWGIFGGQLNCTDGRYVYMKSPMSERESIFQYTLMPTRHGGRRAFIDDKELRQAEMAEGFTFTKGMPVMKIPCLNEPKQAQFKTMLFDMERDEHQEHPYRDSDVEERMEQLLAAWMESCDCPKEMYLRYDIQRPM